MMNIGQTFATLQNHAPEVSVHQGATRGDLTPFFGPSTVVPIMDWINGVPIPLTTNSAMQYYLAAACSFVSQNGMTLKDKDVLNVAVADDPISSPDLEISNDSSTGATRAALTHALEELDAFCPISERFDLGPYVHWKGNATSPMHRWLRYREAYSPELIEKLELGRTILDPFSGCGSIPVGAAKRGRTAFGIDLNPIAAFSSQVKLRRLSDRSLQDIRTFKRTLASHVAYCKPAPLPALSIASKVFEPEVLNLVLRSRSALEQQFKDDQPARDFVFLAWLSILETVGSYFKEGNGIKYRNKKRKEGRYEERADGEWQLKRFGADQSAFFFRVFADQLETMLKDAQEWDNGSWDEQIVVEGSAFELKKIVGDRTFDSVVFSPPYANRFDYFEAFKVELWFGNFVNSYEELQRLRKTSLRSHLNADMKRPVERLDALERLIGLMDTTASSWRMGVAELLRGYFHDLRLVLEQCRQVAPHGRCYVVVGNSAFAGVIIPTDILTAMVGLEAGFNRTYILETRHLTVAPQQRAILAGFEKYMRESIVVFE